MGLRLGPQVRRRRLEVWMVPTRSWHMHDGIRTTSETAPPPTAAISEGLYTWKVP